MKYYIQSKANGNVIVSAETLDKILDLASAYEDNHFDDAIVLDDEGNCVQDWFDFVYDIVANEDSGCTEMDLNDANVTLTEWAKEGIEIPAGLNAEDLMYIWNQAIVDLDRLYQECIHDDDAAEYEMECREASEIPYKPEDPQMVSLQNVLDFAVLDCDQAGAEWKKMDAEGEKIPGMLHRLYQRYDRAEGFLEGITTAIFAAGYSITTNTETGKMTVTK